jgi:hypothetical protein
MTNTGGIQWKRISVEGIAIVASILLAFAIDAWWDDRKERELEREALDDLRAEYEDHRDDVTSANARHLNYLLAIQTLLESCRRGSWDTDEFTLDDAIFALQVPETVDLGAGVRDTLISSGKLDIFQDKNLRYELAEWDSVLFELSDDQLNGADMVFGLIQPYLVRSGVQMSGPLSKSPGQQFWSIPVRSLSISSEPMISICSDPEFLAIVELRYGFMVHTAFEFDGVISGIESMLRRIDESLNR